MKRRGMNRQKMNRQKMIRDRNKAGTMEEQKEIIAQFRESQRNLPRRKKILKDIKQQEQLISDFVHGGCTDQNGEPTNVNCTEFWEKYQNELNQPGCRSCAKRKVLKKYIKLIENLGLGNE